MNQPPPSEASAAARQAAASAGAAGTAGTAGTAGSQSPTDHQEDMETQAEQVGAIQRATFNDRIVVNTGPFSPIQRYVLARRVVSENISKDGRKRPIFDEDTIAQSSI